MQTKTQPRPKPVVMAERRERNATRTAERYVREAAGIAAQERLAADASAAALAEMREDRDRWRAQAERLAGALERLKMMPQPSSAAPVANVGPSNEEDVLYGVPRIAKTLKLTPQQVYHLKDRHGLPTFKIGRLVCAKAGAVRRWLAEREAAATATTEGAR